MKCHIVLPKQHDMHSGIKELLHYSAPFSQGLALVLNSLLESNIINRRDRRAYEGITWFSLTGQLSQDVFPPTRSQPRLSDNATFSCAPWQVIIYAPCAEPSKRMVEMKWF